MRAFLIAASAVLFASSAQAGDNPATQMTFFAGCWRGQFVNEAGVSDDRCFEPVQGGVFLRDTHQVRGGPGAYGGETIYYLDAQAQRLAFTYYASDGGMSRGFADVSETGVAFPPGTYVGADGATLNMRGSWTRDGADRYVAVSEIETNGEWREHLRIVYTRAPDLRPPLAP